MDCSVAGEFYLCGCIIRLASMGVGASLISAQGHRRFTVVVGLVSSLPQWLLAYVSGLFCRIQLLLEPISNTKTKCTIGLHVVSRILPRLNI